MAWGCWPPRLDPADAHRDPRALPCPSFAPPFRFPISPRSLPLASLAASFIPPLSLLSAEKTDSQTAVRIRYLLSLIRNNPPHPARIIFARSFAWGLSCPVQIQVPIRKRGPAQRPLPFSPSQRAPHRYCPVPCAWPPQSAAQECRQHRRAVWVCPLRCHRSTPWAPSGRSGQ